MQRYGFFEKLLENIYENKKTLEGTGALQRFFIQVHLFYHLPLTFTKCFTKPLN